MPLIVSFAKPLAAQLGVSGNNSLGVSGDSLGVSGDSLGEKSSLWDEEVLAGSGIYRADFFSPRPGVINGDDDGGGGGGGNGTDHGSAPEGRSPYVARSVILSCLSVFVGPLIDLNARHCGAGMTTDQMMRVCLGSRYRESLYLRAVAICFLFRFCSFPPPRSPLDPVSLAYPLLCYFSHPIQETMMIRCFLLAISEWTRCDSSGYCLAWKWDHVCGLRTDLPLQTGLTLLELASVEIGS